MVLGDRRVHDIVVWWPALMATAVVMLLCAAAPPPNRWADLARPTGYRPTVAPGP